MADKTKSKEEKIVLERVYNVPLRREWLKSPKYKRAKKAINALKEFVAKNMKSQDVRIGTFANLAIWKQGIKNPPHHLKVKCTKYEDGKVVAELDAHPNAKVPSVLIKARAKAEKKPKKAKEETPVEKSEDKEKEIKAENAEKSKEIEAEEVKEMKKESQAPKPRGHEAFAREQKQFEKPDYLKSPKSSQKMAGGEHKQQAKAA